MPFLGGIVSLGAFVCFFSVPKRGQPTILTFKLFLALFFDAHGSPKFKTNHEPEASNNLK